jgi:hypothetical protein
MPTNAEIQAQFNDMLKEATKLLANQQSYLQKHVDLLKQMAETQKSINSSIGEGKLKEMSDTMQDMAEYVEDYNDKMEDTIEHVEDYNEAIDEQLTVGQKLNKHLQELAKNLTSLKPGEAALSGVSNGFVLFQKIGGAAFGTLGSLIDVLKNLGAGLIAFPLNILNNLTAMAGSAHASTELAEALERVRKQFGHLDRASGLAVRNMAAGITRLANTGLSGFRVFGTAAQQLDAVREYAEALGPVFLRASQQIGEQGAGALFAYNKALGLTAEAQRAIAARAVSSGRTVNSVNRDIANYAIQLSDAFGLSAKEVGRDIGNMMADMDHFGHLAPKELGQVAVYARRLGIEVTKLAQIMDKTLNFEDAANQASQLSQAFGLNIDAFEQMREQDPAKQMDNLRRAFFAAGKSIENMTRQERALLQQQTGLDQQTLEAAFSLRNQGVAYDEVRRRGDAARRSQLTQEQVMLRLSGAIERLVQQQSSFSSFMNAFARGFDIGIKRSSEFMRLMRNLRASMSVVFRAGREVGRAFVELFPGVKQIFGGIADFFDPRRMRTMMRGVVDAFRSFFRDLDFKAFTDRISSQFGAFVSNSPAGARLLDGIKKFFTAAKDIAIQGLRLAINGIKDAVKYITDLLRGNVSLGAGGAGGQALGFVAGIFKDLKDAVGPALSDLWKVIKELWTTVIQPKAVEFLKENMITILGVLFGPSLILGAGRGLAAAGGRAIGSLLAQMFASKPATDAAQKGLASLMGSISSSPASRAVGQVPSMGPAISQIGQAAVTATQQRANFPQATSKLVQMAPFIVALGVLIAAVAGLSMLVKSQGITIKEVGVAAAMVGASSAVLYSIVATAQAASMIKPEMAAKAALGVVAAGLFGGAIGLGMLGLIKMFKGITLSEVGVVLAAMGGATLVILAISAVVLVAAAASTGLAAVGPAVIGLGAAVLFGTAISVGMMALIQAYRRSRIRAEEVNSVVSSIGKATGLILGIAGALAIIGSTGPLIVAGLAVAMGTLAIMKRLLPTALNIVSDMASQIVGTVSSIMRSINRIPYDQNSEVRISAFVRVISGLGSFVGSVAQVLSAVGPSFSDFLTGGSNVSSRIAAIPSVLTSLTGSITNIVQILTRSVAAFGSGPEADAKIRAAGVIGDIIGSVGTFARSIGEVVSQNAGNVSTFDRVVSAFAQTADPLVTRMNQLNDFMLTVVNRAIVPLISRIVQAIPASFTAEQARAAGVLIDMFRGVTELAKALIPSPELIGALNRGANFHGQIEGIRTLIGTVTNLVSGNDGILARVRNLVMDMPNIGEAQAARLRVVAPVIESVFRGISSIADVISTMSRGFTSLPGNNATTIIAAQTASINNLFNRIGGLLPSVVSQLRDLRLSEGEARSIRSKTGAVRAIFETIQALSTAFNSFARGEGANRRVDSGVIWEAISAVTLNLANLFDPRNAPARNLISAVQGMQTFPDTRGVVTKVNAVKSLFEAFSTVSQSLTNITSLSGHSLSDGLARMNEELTNALPRIEQFRGAAFERIGSAIRDMVHDVNDIGRAFSTISPINLETHLQRTADNMGLAQTHQFRVERGRINLLFQAQIYLDGAELEYLLLTRANSHIQQTPGPISVPASFTNRPILRVGGG